MLRDQSLLCILLIGSVAGCAPANENILTPSSTLLGCVPTVTPKPIGTRTPTPRPDQFGTPPPPSSTLTPIPFSRTVDLAPDLSEDQKTHFIVYRCNGSYELFLGRYPQNAQSITETLKLQPGDILVTMFGPYPPITKIVRPPPPPTLRIEGITLEEARQNFGFHLLEPAYLPKGFGIRYVTHWGLMPGDQINLDYAGSPPASKANGQSFVTILERSYPIMPTPPGGIPPVPTPDTENVRVRGTSALVDRSFSPPAWFTPEPPTQLYPSLEWGENNLIVTVGGSLSLEELIKIAQSLK